MTSLIKLLIDFIVSLVNFESYDHATIDHKNLEYDYRSVMHYGEYDYSTGGGLKSIEAVNSAPIGMAAGLSYLDIVSINLLYQCHGKEKKMISIINTWVTISDGCILL